MRIGSLPGGGARLVIIVLDTEPFEAALDVPGVCWAEVLIYNVVAAMLLEFIIFFMR